MKLLSFRRPDGTPSWGIVKAGDVIVTRTTGGVGAYQKPPLWMKPGDTIEVEISNIGVLRNPVVQEE
jgi:2-keto-4-pentenoate hydratase/2-oxohepta-3-ene-1,7-dioic acid hydratase in catechol pathway